MLKRILVKYVLNCIFCSIFHFTSFAASTDRVVQLQMSILMDSCSSSGEKEKAIRVLSENLNPEVLTLFVDTIIKEHTPSVQIKAFLALLNIAPREPVAIPYLHQAAYAVSGSDEVRMRELACEALLIRLDEAGTKELLSILLNEIKRDQDATTKKGEIASDRTNSVIGQCTGGLALCGKRHIDLIKTFYYENHTGELSYCLAHVLFKLGEAPDTTVIIEGIKNTMYSALRLQLLWDIEKIGDRRIMPVLEKFKDDETIERYNDRTIGYPIRDTARRILNNLKEDKSETQQPTITSEIVE